MPLLLLVPVPLFLWHRTSKLQRTLVPSTLEWKASASVSALCSSRPFSTGHPLFSLAEKIRQGLVAILNGHWLISQDTNSSQSCPLEPPTTAHFAWKKKKKERKHRQEETAASDFIPCPRKNPTISSDIVMVALPGKFLLILCRIPGLSEVFIKCTDF